MGTPEQKERLNGIYKLILFDLADTLIHLWEVRSIAFLTTGKELDWDERNIAQLEAVWGKPIDEMVRILWPGMDVDRFEEAYLVNKTRFPVTEIAGAKIAVQKLIDSGYNVGILTSTNSRMLQANLGQAGLGYLNFLIRQSSDDTSVHKPDGRVFDPTLLKIQGLGIEKTEVLYVGDDINDYLACQEADIPFVAVLTGRTKRQEFIDNRLAENRILDSVANLPNWLGN